MPCTDLRSLSPPQNPAPTTRTTTPTPTQPTIHPSTLPLQGSMFVGVNVPRVEAKDLRPEVPPEQSLVISSGHKASFLMLDVSAGSGRAKGGICPSNSVA